MADTLRKLFYWIAYIGNPPWDTGISPPELLDFLETHPSGRALDLGCGTGTNLLTISREGWEAVGVDFSGRAVSLARNRLSQAGMQVTLVKGDVTQRLAIEGQFDLILDIGCYHDLAPALKGGYRRNIRERLAPGGSLLMYAHWFTPDHPRGTGVDEGDIQEFSQFLIPERIQHSTDRWERHTAWLTFKRSHCSTREGF